MSDNQAANKKEKDWKENLLKSSLPLEQIVSKKLKNKQMGIVGEYSYIRPNEKGIHTEFSIDLHAIRFLDKRPQSIPSDTKYAASLNLLIECKYNHPGVRWVFSPYPNPTIFEMPLTIFRLQKTGKHSTVTLDLDTQPFLPSCTRGIELHNNGFDPNNISRGLSQLRYGMPNLILQEIDRLKPPDRLQEQSLIGLMLVTTADLYVLKADQDIETYRSAESLEDVAQKVDALVVSQERGPHLQHYCEELSVTRFNRKALNRVEQQLIKNAVNEDFPMDFQIIVVGLNALEDVIELIVDSIKNNSRLMQVDEIE